MLGYTVYMGNTFPTWLTKEIERRGWTVREAALRDAWDSEPDAGQLRDVLYDLRARAEGLFRMPARQVSALLQQAGLRVDVEEGEIVSLALGV